MIIIWKGALRYDLNYSEQSEQCGKSKNKVN